MARRIAFAASVALILTAACAPPATAAAPPATLTGHVSKLPAPSARVFATARAVVARTGQVVAVQDLGAASRYRLRVGSGRFVVVAAADGRDGRLARVVSRLLTARRGHTARKNLKARASAAGGPVVTIGDIRLTPQPGVRGPTLLLRDRIITDLFGPLTARGVRIVDLSAAVVAALKREQKLSDDGRSDVRYTYSPLEPQFEITGTGLAGPGGALSLQLDLKNIATGQVVSTKTVSGTGGNVAGLIADAAGGLLADADTGPALDALPPPACPPDCAGTGKVVVDIGITFLFPGTPGSGTVSVTPPGRTFAPADLQNTTLESVVPDGTTITLVGIPGAGSYFVGWQSGSECGGYGYEPPGDTYNCTVTDPGSGRFAINVGADFALCPPPGTFVFNAPLEAVCPGVTIVH